ncbi:carboxylate-amine ligase [Streptosporangium sandarakinum]|uniref:carboxylate-amine ligase n=1 Tax=Streptosporangium sandarakinum TaxID=1260955 RepID=UPI003D8FE306
MAQQGSIDSPTGPDTAPRTQSPSSPAVLPVGVEEEFFLMDPDTGQTAPRASAVLATVRPRQRELTQREFTTCQVEIASNPHTDLGLLRAELTDLRTELARAARDAGCRLIASGSAPLEHSASGARLTDNPRYKWMAHEYGAMARGENCCGCHVHVEVPDREEAVQVCNHLRPWLPTLLTLTVNSPFTGGADSRYGSWRAMAFSRWPSAELPPYFESAADYAATLQALIGSGAILDEGMVYWLARPSHHLPTVEVRVGDVCPTVEESVAFAALVRALVTTVLDDVRAGVPAPRPHEPVLHAAYWRAARDGLEGQGLELTSATLVPAWRLTEQLLERVRPALSAAGDTDMVVDYLSRLHETGSGAARQRAAFAERGSFADVVTALSRQTAPLAG